MIKTLLTVSAVCCVLGTGIAFAQAPAPSTQPAPKATAVDKQAISKSCSTQADAKGLHGKQRKKFRSTCRKNGGKAS